MLLESVLFNDNVWTKEQDRLARDVSFHTPTTEAQAESFREVSECRHRTYAGTERKHVRYAKINREMLCQPGLTPHWLVLSIFWKLSGGRSFRWAALWLEEHLDNMKFWASTTQIYGFLRERPLVREFWQVHTAHKGRLHSFHGILNLSQAVPLRSVKRLWYWRASSHLYIWSLAFCP